MIAPQAHIPATKNLELSAAEAETLTQELAGIIDSARYPVSPSYPNPAGDLGQVEAGAGAGAVASTEGVRAAASECSPKASPRFKDAIIQTAWKRVRDGES